MRAAVARARDDERRADHLAWRLVLGARPTSGRQESGRGQGRRGAPVPQWLRDRVRELLDVDVDGVRVHVGPVATIANALLGSRAFTIGQDVFVRRGHYRPESLDGALLLAHEIAHTLQQRRTAWPRLQAKFGFEFELLVPVSSGAARAEAPPLRARIPKPRGNPGETTGSPSIGSEPDKQFRVDTDHASILSAHKSPAWPSGEEMTNLEIVTAPLDETACTEAEVRRHFGAIEGWAELLLEHVRGGRRPADSCLTVADPAAGNFIGPSAGRENDPGLTVAAYVQESYGIPLHLVTREFRDRGEQAPALLKAQGKWGRVLLLAANEGPTSYTSAALAVGPGGLSSAAAAELRGLYALICYYALIWKAPTSTSTLAKNKVGIFYYKTQLSTLRNQLAAEHPTIGTFLDDPARRSAVLDAMLTPMNVKVASTRAWADAVLAGTRDSFFLDTANPYSAEIVEQPRAGELTVVVENRDLRSTRPVTTAFGDLANARYAPAEWPEIAVELWWRLRRLRGLPVT